jgi:succinate-semialdehyde dehydrogenase / glutarate-semialdehyde dehydrogenase
MKKEIKPKNLPPAGQAVPPEISIRLDLLNSLADSLARHQEALVTAAGQDIGTPCRVAATEVQLAVAHLQTMAQDIPHVLHKVPYGTVAAIFPYDAVPVMLGRVGGAAVLGGNTFRFSFSSQTPRSAHIVADLLRPFPMFQPNTGLDNRQFGAACVADPAVQVLFISGGGEVGRLYEAQASAFAKLFFAGPSGMPAAVIAADADVVAVSRHLVRRAFINGGQYCTTIKKAYIAAPVYDAVKNALQAFLADIRVGEPQDPEAWIGPIKVERTRRLIQEAVRRLDRPRFVQPPDLASEFIKPIICEVDDVPDLEMFGPFLALIKVARTADAINRAVRTRYPFAVSLFGSAPPEAVALLQQTFGMVYLNPDFTFTPLRLPFGGKKDSGWILENKGDQMTRRDGAFIYSAELVHDP